MAASETVIQLTMADGTSASGTLAQFRQVVQQVKRSTGQSPMKEDPDFRQHNQHAFNVTADELRQFIERFEQFEAEKKDISEQQKELMSEAKSRGYDTKVMRKIVALRKRQPDDIAEEEAVLELYKQALGMT